MELCPLKQRDAFDFIGQHHRHHKPPVGSLWQHGVMDDEGVVVGACVVGRPVARRLDDGLTVEITRLCTLGHENACSMLYAAARRVAIDKGYRRGITYILESEDGGSLRASGWKELWKSPGRSWSVPSRPREDKHPLVPKTAYGWGAWPQLGSD